MPVYICELCNYSTKIKTQLERHKNTKKHRIRSMGIDDNIIVYGGVFKKDPIGPKKTQKDPLETPKDPEETKKIEKKKKTFFCDFCNTKFTTFAHKRRHELHRCKLNYNKLLDDKDNEILQLKNEKHEIYKKIDKLLEKVGNTTNIQNNISVNNYGNEFAVSVKSNSINSDDIDTYIDNGTDNDIDNGINNGTDNDTDNGTDNGIDNGTDNGIDNGTDNGIDNGTDNGTDNYDNAIIAKDTDDVFMSNEEHTDIRLTGGERLVIKLKKVNADHKLLNDQLRHDFEALRKCNAKKESENETLKDKLFLFYICMVVITVLQSILVGCFALR